MGCDMAEQFTTNDRPKRPRPVVSCLECRRKKLKCDRSPPPCSQCSKGGRAHLCAYAPGQEPDAGSNAQNVDGSSRRSQASTCESDSGGGPDARQVDDLIGRLRDLEQTLQAQKGRSAMHGVMTSKDSPMDMDDEDERFRDRIPVDNGMSIWSRFRNAHEFVASSILGMRDAEIEDIAMDVYVIQSMVNRPRSMTGTAFMARNQLIGHMVQLLPGQDVCVKLVHLYFENFEHCRRILHRPTFLEQSNLFYSGQMDGIQKDAYVPLLIGVISIASSLNTLPECHLPLFHDTQRGTGAVQLLDNILHLMSSSERLSVAAIQVQILSMQSQKSQLHDTKTLWIKSAQVIREAMVIRLHEEPSSQLDCIDREVRRRLWLTILEQDLTLSIICDMPPNNISFDLKSPLSIDDTNLTIDGGGELTAPPSTEEWTDGLCQHVLAQSFNARLEAYNLRYKSRSSCTYSEVLEHARILEKILRELPVPFTLDHNNSPGRLIAQMELDITLRRPLIALYAPFAQSMPADDRYREARIAWVQSSLVVLCFQDLFDPKFPVIDVPQPEGYWDLYYTVYKDDVMLGLQTELLELQRMILLQQTPVDQRQLELQQHAARSHTRALGWTADGMRRSVEDTVEPMVRRIGRDGADFDQILRWIVVFNSLTGNSDDIDTAIRLGLKKLVKPLRSRLERETSNISSETGSAGHFSSSLVPMTGSSIVEWLSDFLLGRFL